MKKLIKIIDSHLTGTLFPVKYFPIVSTIVLETLEQYNEFLLKNGYTDTDIISEEPTALDQFLNEEK